jgi:N-acetylglucosaminyl-diphospho-decaprenol L-rhamnosyltransferase
LISRTKSGVETIASENDDACVVIAVTYNSASTIEAFLTALAHEGADVYQLVIVDNGSSDETVDLIKRFAADTALDMALVESHNSGFAGGYEVGRQALAARNRPLLCINPDVILSAGTISRLLEALRTQPAVAIATAPLIGLDGLEDSASRRSLPNLTSGSLYGVFGKFLPRRWRYNSATKKPVVFATLPSGPVLHEVQATTGALMMLSPTFRDGSAPIFDLDYWMYGEDLQLCFDAARHERKVVVVEVPPSVHVKGVSSGWPRSPASHLAFHRAMITYYEKNLRTTPLVSGLVKSAIWSRFTLTSIAAALARRRDRLRKHV